MTNNAQSRESRPSPGIYVAFPTILQSRVWHLIVVEGHGVGRGDPFRNEVRGGMCGPDVRRHHE